jgi:deazaflavin-dependent oxidoreductase (nitroreductase family)
VSLDDVGEQLAGWGRVAIVETMGRHSGLPVRVAVGFIAADGGDLVVAAGSPDADWARNLEASPQCRVTLGERTWEAIAEPLTGDEAAAAVRDLILRYGTPAEGLGRGPAFRLRPAMDLDK